MSFHCLIFFPPSISFWALRDIILSVTSARIGGNVQIKPYEIVFLWLKKLQHWQFHMVQPNVYWKVSPCFWFVLPDLYVFYLLLFFYPSLQYPSLFTNPMQRSSICFLLENKNNKMSMNEVNCLLKINIRGSIRVIRGGKGLDPLNMPLSISWTISSHTSGISSSLKAGLLSFLGALRASLAAQTIKNLPAMQET